MTQMPVQLLPKQPDNSRKATTNHSPQNAVFRAGPTPVCVGGREQVCYFENDGSYSVPRSGTLRASVYGTCEGMEGDGDTLS